MKGSKTWSKLYKNELYVKNISVILYLHNNRNKLLITIFTGNKPKWNKALSDPFTTKSTIIICPYLIAYLIGNLVVECERNWAICRVDIVGHERRWKSLCLWNSCCRSIWGSWPSAYFHHLTNKRKCFVYNMIQKNLYFIKQQYSIYTIWIKLWHTCMDAFTLEQCG